MNKHTTYQKNSLSLVGTISLGTGVMIGAGIFSLTGQMAEMSGACFPFAFLAAAIVVAFSAYSYVKMSQAFPSAGALVCFYTKPMEYNIPDFCLLLLEVRRRVGRNRSCICPSLYFWSSS